MVLWDARRLNPCTDCSDTPVVILQDVSSCKPVQTFSGAQKIAQPGTPAWLPCLSGKALGHSDPFRRKPAGHLASSGTNECHQFQLCGRALSPKLVCMAGLAGEPFKAPAKLIQALCGTLGMEGILSQPDRCLDDSFWIAIVRIDKGAVLSPELSLAQGDAVKRESGDLCCLFS